ncbi:MAG: hypothetical protein H0X51_02245 [Parachlamydiaceae bacterium]|nr:hypothetical protein [Parachlamydiaceae bacterium]
MSSTALPILLMDYAQLDYSETFKYAALNALATCTVVTIYTGGNFTAGVISGALSAVALILHRLTGPLFHAVLSSKTLPISMEIARRLLINYSIGKIIYTIAGKRIDIVAAAAVSIISAILQYDGKKVLTPETSTYAYFGLSLVTIRL